jgi:hypothetical protein
MTLNFESVNWLAVGVAAIATFFLGGIWYTALAKPWQRLHGYSDEQVSEMKKLRPPAVFFGGMIASYVILAAVLGVLFATFGVASLAAGLTVGLLLWLGISLPIGITAWIASNKPFGAFAIDFAYQLVFLLMVGAILGAWR